jgi:hypothetical protein
VTRVADRLLIAGVGLIGASLGLALRERGVVGEVVGLGRSAANLRTAKRRGALDRAERDPARACRDVDLVVIATPVGTIAPLFATLADALPERAVITDAGSVKAPVVAAVERVLGEAPAGVTAPAIALHKALLTPWLPEDPEVVDRATLEARSGAPLSDDLLERLVGIGVVVPLPDGRLEVASPILLRAGLQVVALGIPPEAVVAAQLAVTEHAQAAAQIYVDMFRDTVWRPFADAGQPEQEWPRVQQAVERVQPVASQAMLAAFRIAMAQAIQAALGEELGSA